MKGRQMVKLAPSGVVIDPAPESVDPAAWTKVRNIMFRDHSERVRGNIPTFGTPLFPPRWVQFGFASDKSPVWLYAGDAGIAVFNGTSHVNVTPVDFIAAVELENAWTGGSLNNVLFCGNGRRFWYWPGTGLMLRLPTWGDLDQAGAIRPYQYHLIAMKTTDAGAFLPDEIAWSSAANPGSIPATWLAAPNNEAGTAQLSSTAGVCVDGRVLRDKFIVYKNTSAYSVTYVGGSAVMVTRLLFGEGGILTRNCVAGLLQNHVVLTDGDVIVHDGQVARSIAEGRVRRAMFSRANGDQIRRSFVVTDENNGEVWVVMPEAGSDRPNLAYIWNQLRDNWSVRSLDEKADHMAAGQVRIAEVSQAWDTDTQAWDMDPSPWDQGAPRIDYYALLGASGSSNAFYAIDGDTLDNGEPVDALLVREGLGLDDAERVKVLKAVWLEARGTPGTVLNVAVAGVMLPDGSYLYGPTQAFVIGSDQKVNCYASGRYLGVVIGSQTATPTEPWQVVSMTLEVELRGMY